MDFMQQERERGITIKAAATTTSWGKVQNKYYRYPRNMLILLLKSKRSLRVLDGGVVVLDDSRRRSPI